MNRATVIVANVAPSTEVKLRALLQEVEPVSLSVARRDGFHRHGGAPAVVALSSDLEESFRLVHELDRQGLRVVVVGPRKDADLILRSMREGAKEFVLEGDDEELVRVLRGLISPTGADTLGVVCAVFPAKGGVGATTIAANLAGALQQMGRRTCLVDLNLNMGDVLAFLDLAGGFSIADLVTNMRRLDRELLDASLLQHRSGVHVVAQSHRIEESDRITPEALASVLAFLRQHYEAVVVDGLRSFDDVSVAAVDASEHVLLLLTQEVPAVRDAKRCVDLFRRLGAESKLKLVVNRFQKGPEITSEVVVDTVGLPVHATVANDYPAVIAAVNKGVLLQESAPRSQVAKDIAELAKLVGASRGQAQPQRRSLFGRFFGLKGSYAAQ